MDTIFIKQETTNYGSLGYSPEFKPRILVDIPKKNEYTIITFANLKLVVLGPHWPIFFVAYLGFCAASYYMINNLYDQNQDIRTALIISIFQAITYLLIGIYSDPGLCKDISLNLSYAGQVQHIPCRPSQTGVWYCGQCQMIQPPKSGHCQFCNICIKGFDHHCPWTGKCIGQKNMVLFICFLVSTMIYFSYYIFIFIK